MTSAAVTTSGADTSGDDDSASSSETGPVDDCPPGIDGLEYQDTYLGVPVDWEQVPPDSVQHAVCDAIERIHKDLIMSCTNVVGDAGPREVILGSDLPEVQALEDALLGQTDLQLRFIGTSDDPFQPIVGYTLRNASGDLLLLQAGGAGEVDTIEMPEGPLPTFGVADWFAPLLGAEVVDVDCACQDPPNLSSRRPYAVDVETPTGTVRLHHREELAVSVDENDYLLSLASAALYGCAGRNTALEFQLRLVVVALP